MSNPSSDEAPQLFLHYVAVKSGDPYTFHVEFQLDYSRDIPSRMARYGVSLTLQHNRRVLSILLLLRPVPPAAIPGWGEFVIGDTSGGHGFRVVRLWEVEAAPVLASRNPHLLPWTVTLGQPSL